MCYLLLATGAKKKNNFETFPMFLITEASRIQPTHLLLARSGLFPSTAPILVSGRVPGENISFKAAPPKKKQPPCHFSRYTRGKNNDDPYISRRLSLSLGLLPVKKKTCHFQKHSETFVAPGGVVLKLAHIHVHCIENLGKKYTHTFRRCWFHKFQKGKKKKTWTLTEKESLPEKIASEVFFWTCLDKNLARTS